MMPKRLPKPCSALSVNENACALISMMVRSAEFAGVLAFAGMAYTVGGDMTLTVPALFFAWIIGSIEIATVRGTSGGWKVAAVVGLSLILTGEGAFLYWHFHRQGPGTMDGPASENESCKSLDLTVQFSCEWSQLPTVVPQHKLYELQLILGMGGVFATARDPNQFGLARCADLCLPLPLQQSGAEFDRQPGCRNADVVYGIDQIERWYKVRRCNRYVQGRHSPNSLGVRQDLRFLCEGLGDGATADAVHSSSAPITGYTNATPSGSFCRNHFSIAGWQRP
jgi:hypothetical protein